MNRTEITVAAEQGGATLGAVVRAASDGLPWRRVNKLVRDGKVRVDDETCRDPATRMRAGMRIVVDPHARPGASSAAGPGSGIDLLFVDPHVVVVDKPAGVMSVPWQDERDTVVHLAHSALRRKLGVRHLPPLRVVQRLDKDTSGVMVFARTRSAERHLAGLLRAHDIERRYVALCEGVVEDRTHDTHLVPDRGDGRRGSARGRKPPAHAKRAITHVACAEVFTLADGGKVSRVVCTLQTGRQHQIRIHLAEAGHALLGERVYGQFGRPLVLPAVRPMLHAEHLGFLHPARDEVVRFDGPLPDDFRGLLDRLRAGS